MTTPAPAEPTAAELISVVQSCADEIDRRLSAAALKLEAATQATIDLPKLRDEVRDLSHEMRSLRTAISAINDIQDRTSPPPPTTKGQRR
jgi:hypothetical protein